MPIKGGYLFMAGAGGLLVWSGLTGKSWSQVFRDVLTGQNPQTTLTAYTIHPGTPPTSQDLGNQSGGGGGGKVTAPSGPGERAWDVAFLATIGAPPTAANIRSLVAWRGHESPWNNQPPDGALYTHNPFNTTWPMPGATSINSVGVKRYVSTVSGLAALRATITSGQYSDVLSALRSGKGLCGRSFNGLSTWSGGGYSSVC